MSQTLEDRHWSRAFEYLLPEDLLSASGVCVDWRRVVNQMWGAVIRTQFPDDFQQVEPTNGGFADLARKHYGGLTPDEVRAFSAAKHGDSSELLRLQDHALSAVDVTGATPLHWAFRRGLLRAARALLSNDCLARSSTDSDARERPFGGIDRRAVPLLVYVARHGRADCVEALLELGASLSGDDSGTLGVDHDGEAAPALLAAAEGGHAAVLELLLLRISGGLATPNGGESESDSAPSAAVTPSPAPNNHVATMMAGPVGSRLLALATRAASVEAVALLLRWGATLAARPAADANSPGSTAAVVPGPPTALHVAAEAGNVQILQTLLAIATKHELDLLAVDDAPRASVSAAAAAAASTTPAATSTPLMRAVRGGHTDAAHDLMAAGASVVAVASDGSTALFDAAASGHLAVAVQLLDAGADVNAANHQGDTPLHAAAYAGADPVVAELLRRGAAVGAVNSRGEAGLHIAARRGAGACVRTLVAGGADVNAPEAKRERLHPLHMAISAVPWTETAVECLLAAGASLAVRDYSGNTPLHAAAAAGREAVVSALIDAGGDKDATNVFGMTPFITACAFGHQDIGKQLLQAGAAVGAHNEFAIAAHYGHADLLLLLQGRMNIRLPSPEHCGGTALHVAARFGHLRCVELLLEMGFERQALDDVMRTPAQWAHANKRDAVEQLLTGRNDTAPGSEDSFDDDR